MYEEFLRSSKVNIQKGKWGILTYGFKGIGSGNYCIKKQMNLTLI